MGLTFPWPVPPGYSQHPHWNGNGFQIGDQRLSILSYTRGDTGWTEDLTLFHEENAGPDHFIDRASRAHALQQVKRYLPGPFSVVLEIGCSSGFFLRELRRELPNTLLIGADFVRRPLEQLARDVPDVPLLQFDLLKCPLPENSVDVVVLLNVLEHIKDDALAMQQVHRILKPGGTAVIEVPAAPHLFDVYDKLLMHYRRYNLKGLRRLLKNVGFSIVFTSNLGAFLYPGFWYVKKKNRRYLSAPEDVQKNVVAAAIRKSSRNCLFELVMWVEEKLRNVVSLPFGIRCLATCMKQR